MNEEIKKTDDNEDSKEAKQKTEEIQEDNQIEKKISKPVVVRAEAYKTIILYASRYSNKSIPPKEWKEIYGVLVGYSDEEILYVERAEPLAFGHATDVQLDERHYGFIEEIQNKLYNEGKGKYIIGWFHSHPGLGLFFSYIDLINQLFFQGLNDDSCGLVFDHTLLGKKKLEKIEGSEHTITKYDTGFEIYRITDIEMDVDNPKYDNNYHKVDYVVDGLSKYFFANVLSELSALATEGKPLQSAYGEGLKFDNLEKYEYNSDIDLENSFLMEIPMSEEVNFNMENLFYETDKSEEIKEEMLLKENAEKYIFEGNLSFKNKNMIEGIENYKKGIEKYKELHNNERTLELLRDLSEKCILNDQLNFAKEFADELKKEAKKVKNLFYLGEYFYLIGNILLKEGDNSVLEKALRSIEKAAVEFEKIEDFAGAGACFYKIGSIYHSQLNNLESTCLFYREAVENYNKAILRNHPLRKSMWAKQEIMIKRVISLRSIIEELLPKLDNLHIKKKVKEDLDSIEFNF